MARQLGLEFGGANCHVAPRGNRGRDIYGDDHDRKLWLRTLGEACEKTGWRARAWVIRQVAKGQEPRSERMKRELERKYQEDVPTEL